MRKVYKILLQMLSAGALIILGLLLGLRTAQQDILKEMQRSTVQTIAIVNMDEGIMDGEEKVYYAEQMFTYPDMDYEVTDLNDAVSGVEHGKYAAYIIIPANFSESVSSINAEPSRANLEYAVNRNLRDDINEQVRRRITAFENMLNNNIEYMYLSAVLQEFHKAQDSAQIVMNNDTEDMEVLMQVQPDDISESVVLENGETVPYDIGLLDLLTYYDSNAELIAGINDYYDQAQEEADAAFQEIAEAGEQVGDYSSLTDLYGVKVFSDDFTKQVQALSRQQKEKTESCIQSVCLSDHYRRSAPNSYAPFGDIPG